MLFLHGNPSTADDWEPFLDRLEGRRRCIAPHVIGWGEADRPQDFRWTMDNLVGWIGALIDALEIERFDLVMHDWGALGLAAAQRRPAMAGRIVVMNAVPLLPGYRWHWVARLWRRRGVGELMLATLTRFATRQVLRQTVMRPQARPLLADIIHEHLDRGTKRAILELYRDADEDRLARVGSGLEQLDGSALVLWGDRDAYIDARFADDYASALGGAARVEHLPDAGHWPWLDRPDVVEAVGEFLEQP